MAKTASYTRTFHGATIDYSVSFERSADGFIDTYQAAVIMTVEKDNDYILNNLDRFFFEFDGTARPFQADWTTQEETSTHYVFTASSCCIDTYGHRSHRATYGFVYYTTLYYQYETILRHSFTVEYKSQNPDETPYFGTCEGYYPTPTPPRPSGGGSTPYNPGGTIVPASGETGYNYIYRFLIPEDYVSGETRPLKIQVKQAATGGEEYSSAVTEQWITVYPPRTETRIHATYPNSLRVNVDEGTICIYSIQDGEITLTIPEDNISSAGTPTVIEF